MKSSRLCKEDYEEVKQRLSMRQVATFYGYEVNRNGNCLCPFHNDGHPSMKVYKNDKGFYCWSCGTGGDVVKFVGLLYGLKNEDACRKLIDDFSLPINIGDLTYRERRERSKRQMEYKRLKKFKDEAYTALFAYWKLLCDASHCVKNPHFNEAMQELSIVEYRLICLKEHPDEYQNDREAVRKIGEIERRIIDWNG